MMNLDKKVYALIVNLLLDLIQVNGAFTGRAREILKLLGFPEIV
jgi:hypothetical protein